MVFLSAATYLLIGTCFTHLLFKVLQVEIQGDNTTYQLRWVYYFTWPFLLAFYILVVVIGVTAMSVFVLRRWYVKYRR